MAFQFVLDRHYGDVNRNIHAFRIWETQACRGRLDSWVSGVNGYESRHRRRPVSPGDFEIHEILVVTRA